jgi:hypothetical protein
MVPRITLFLTALFIISACSNEPQTEVDTGSQDTGHQDTDDHDTSTPGGETLEIYVDNQSSTLHYVQIANNSLFNLAWLSITDANDTRLHTSSACLPCPCDAPDSCGICDAPTPYVEELPPGQRISYTWDGTIFRVTSQNGRSCTLRENIGSAPVTVTVCAGISTTGDNPDFPRFVEDPACTSEVLTLGSKPSTGMTLVD